MATAGDWARVAIQGYTSTGQAEGIQYQHSFGQNPVLGQNTGVRQFAPGLYKGQLTVGGYVQRGQGAITASNILADPTTQEYITTVLMGINQAPVAGDVCVIFDGTLIPYKRSQSPQQIQRWNAQFKSRGIRIPLFPLLVTNASPKGTSTSAALDDGAESVGSNYGALACLQVVTPTGTAATGSITATAAPADGDTIVINGTTYTFKTSPSATSHILIPVSGGAIAALQNLFEALVASPVGAGTAYIAGTTAPTTAIYNVPTGSSTSATLAITYATTGTGGNSFTLAKTGAVLGVSGAVLSGGVAGETATSLVLQSATSSGGSYSTFCTFTSDMTRRVAEIQQIAAGVTINRYIKAVVTMSASTMTYGFRIIFGRFFANQA